MQGWNIPFRRMWMHPSKAAFIEVHFKNGGSVLWRMQNLDWDTAGGFRQLSLTSTSPQFSLVPPIGPVTLKLGLYPIEANQQIAACKCVLVLWLSDNMRAVAANYGCVWSKECRNSALFSNLRLQLGHNCHLHLCPSCFLCFFYVILAAWSH